ncbi:MAG: cytochrome c [Cyclobacteriaceae bacterium]|nr:cytochrome c [Cyclobacteriaceae bacterium]
MKNQVLIFTAIFLAIALLSFTQLDQSKDWVVPESAKKMKNPTDPSNKSDLAVGKTLFSKYCESCHGKEGYGDGPKAKEMKGDMGDFSSEEFQAQSDGALFYKIKTGRGDMSSFTKKLPDEEDRWLIINYIRTLKQ